MKKDFLVLTHCRNESRWLNDFLDMCGKISDGVILIDDHSRDNTLEIAKKHPAVLNAWKSYQRTDTVSEGCDYIALLSVAQHYNPEWVMILDADERLDVEQFNNFKKDILESPYNSLSPLWPFFDEIQKKFVYWGWGPDGNKDIVQICYKHDVIMRYSAVTDCQVVPFAHVKPYAKSPQRGYSNLVLKHYCVRPVEERIEKWERRLKAESQHPCGKKEDEILKFIDELKKLPPNSPSYDPWIENMVKVHGSMENINISERLKVSDSPNWDLIIPHCPEFQNLKDSGKILKHG